MRKNDQELIQYNPSKQNPNRIPKEEVLEWSPTGYGLIASVSRTELEEDPEDFS